MLEFAGDLDQFSLAARVALCSAPTELGAYGVFFPPSESVLAHARDVAQRPFAAMFSDADARYEAAAEIDIAALQPQVSTPGGLQNAVPVSEVAGTRIDHAFIGSCASSMYEDIALAARYLAGRRIADGVRLFVVPGSDETSQRLASEGLMQVLLESGAVVLPGGYPELHAKELSQCRQSLGSLVRHGAAGGAMYAECGGLLLLGQELVDADGQRHAMAGLLPHRACRGALSLGYRTAQVKRDGLVVRQGEVLHGHEFHRWQLDDSPMEAAPWQLEGWGVRSRVEGWTDAAVHASWLHLHWGGCPSIPQRLTHAAGKWLSA
ncbi:MAG: hypothetical protein EBU42_09370 [Synechococcus sp.]|nr:hypothetical protein [Synechococcus sp.]